MIRTDTKNLARLLGVDEETLSTALKTFSQAEVKSNNQLDTQQYFQISVEGFECVVDSRDSPTSEEALKRVRSLHPYINWYATEALSLKKENEFVVKTLSHSEYMDWLRKDRERGGK